MKAWLKFLQPLALATVVAVLVGACNEELEGGNACPLLCPHAPASVQDTTFVAVDLDTSIAGYPSLGREVAFFLASFGDTLQTRGAVRYDTLSSRFTHSNSATDSAVVVVDTGAIIRFTVIRGDTLAAGGTVELYDVDLGGAEDADPTAISGAFTPDRFLGSRNYTAKDTLIDVPVDPAKLLAKIQAPSPGNRLRVGVKVTAAGSASLTVKTIDGFAPAQLIYRPSTDSTVVKIVKNPQSLTPADPLVASDLADYLVVTAAPADPPPGVIRVGGLPGRRVYLRFNVPSRIVDSSNVVRATLLLTQRPNGNSPSSSDSLAIAPLSVSAGPSITDLSKALLFLFAPAGTDSVRIVPADSGVRSLEIVRIVKLWGVTSPSKTPRVVAVKSQGEGTSGALLDFFSIEAPDPTVRPRLRITYLPRQQGGLP